MNLRVRFIAGGAVVAFLLFGLVLVMSAPSPGVAAIGVGALAAYGALLIGLAIVIGRDAERHDRDGWLWGALFVFFPIIFGVAYFVVRRREPRSLYPSWTPEEGPEAPAKMGGMGKYSALPFGRAFPLFIAGFCLAIDLVTIPTGSLFFNVAFSLMLLVLAYISCWHIVSELELEGDRLVWRAALRSGVVNVHELAQIEPGTGLMRNAETLVMTNGTKLSVMGGTRFRRFCDALRMLRPDLEVSLSGMTLRQERIWGRRDDD